MASQVRGFGAWSTVITALLTLTLLSACTPPQEGIVVKGQPFTAAQIAQGGEIYAQNCATCHGTEGQGQFPEAPLEPDVTGRRGAPPHNQTGHTWHHSDELLLRYVRDGGFSDPANFYPMPAFGDVLAEAQILEVIAYIKTMWTGEQREYQQRLTADETAEFGS